MAFAKATNPFLLRFSYRFEAFHQFFKAYFTGMFYISKGLDTIVWIAIISKNINGLFETFMHFHMMFTYFIDNTWVYSLTNVREPFSKAASGVS